jgi:hypothetical protein
MDARLVTLVDRLEMVGGNNDFWEGRIVSFAEVIKADVSRQVTSFIIDYFDAWRPHEPWYAFNAGLISAVDLNIELIPENSLYTPLKVPQSLICKRRVLKEQRNLLSYYRFHPLLEGT